jgi:hypothetical protein
MANILPFFGSSTLLGVPHKTLQPPGRTPTKLLNPPGTADEALISKMQC